MTDLFREIRINRLKLEKRKPWPSGAEEQLYDWQKEKIVYYSMHLDGLLLTTETIRSLEMGELVKEASFADYNLVQGLVEALNYITSVRKSVLGSAERIPRLPEMCRMWGMLNGKNEEETLEIWRSRSFLRKENPVLRAMEFVPCHFQDVERELNQFFLWLSKEAGNMEASPIDFAVEAHNRWISVYPFTSHNEALARLLFEAILFANGLPMVPFPMTESEYYSSILDGSLNDKMEIVVDKTLKMALQLTDSRELHQRSGGC